MISGCDEGMNDGDSGIALDSAIGYESRVANYNLAVKRGCVHNL